MLTINISELILTILNFFLLLFVLKKLLFDPVIRFTEDRQRRIDEGVELAKQADEQRLAAEEQIKRQTEETQKKASELIRQGREEDAQRLTEIEKQAQSKEERASEQNRIAAEAVCEKSREELKARGGELAGLLVKRLLE